MRSRTFSRLGVEKFSGLYLWGLFIVVFAVWQPSLFLTKTTFDSIASEQAVVGILALAVLVPLAGGVFDLSVAATINLTTITVVVFQSNYHWGILPAILASLGVGLIIGLINGFIIVNLRVSSFIATLGTTSIIGAVQIMISPTQPAPPISSEWVSLATRSVGGIQIVFWYMVAVSFVVWWGVGHTPAGRYLYAIGGNPDAARLSGVKVSQYVRWSLVVSGLLAAFAGVLYASQSGPSLDYGSGLLLPAFAAVFLGSTQIQPGRVNVWGTLLAIYALATGVRGLQLATSAQWIDSMFNGVALIGAVAFAVWRQDQGRKGVRTPEVGESDGQEVSLLEDRVSRASHPPEAADADTSILESLPPTQS